MNTPGSFIQLLHDDIDYNTKKNCYSLLKVSFQPQKSETHAETYFQWLYKKQEQNSTIDLPQ